MDDPFLTEFLQQIAEMEDKDIRPVMTRVKSWVENGVMRRIVACRESSIDFQEVLDENKIVIVRTPITSDDAKQMITLGTMRPIWTAVQNNSFQGANATREPFFAFFDESDKVLNDNLDVDDMLARARSMKLSVTLACQYPDQLKEAGVLKAVLNNCNNMLAFRVMEDDDARPLMKRLQGYDVEDLVNAENYYIWTKVPVADGGYSDPLKLKTFPPYPPLRSDEEVDEVICESLERYGTEPLTDAQIQANLPFGHLTEALDELNELDMSIEYCRNQALAAVYDQSIREDGTPGFVTDEMCLGRLQHYLPGGEALTDADKAYRSVFQKIPDDYIGVRKTNDGNRELKALDMSFMNIGESENDGGAGHGELLADSYTPLTQLGFRATVPDQTGDAMPDGLASVEDALDLDGVTDPDAFHGSVEEYRREHPLLARLAGAKDAYIEAEKSTGDSQPSQTVLNLAQAHNVGHRCLFTARPDVAGRVYNTVGRAPMGCRSGHSVDGERRFYTGTGDALTIDGEKMTRPGASDNVWVHDEQSGQYILRDHEGTVHARFDSVEEIFTDASKYPDGGERKIKRPVIPEYEFDGDLDDVGWDTIVVPEAPQDEDGRKKPLAPEDLQLYRDEEPNVPVLELLDEDQHSDEPTDSTTDDDLKDGVQGMF